MLYEVITLARRGALLRDGADRLFLLCGHACLASVRPCVARSALRCRRRGLRRLVGCGHQAALLGPALERGLLLAPVTPQARHQIVEVDQMTVEIRPIDAGKLHFVADLDPASYNFV